MSNVNIKRLVENIRAITTHYTPIVETIVNSIQAIEETGIENGQIIVKVIRDNQQEIDDGLRAITGFVIEDNGIGFNDKHRESFDTLYTDLKVHEGGKGFGRFICLKYFTNLHVDSIYRVGNTFHRRKFTMGKENDIILNEKDVPSDETSNLTRVKLDRHIGSGTFEKN